MNIDLMAILNILIPFLTGGGVLFLLNIRAKKRQEINKIAVEEFQSVQSIVNSSMQQMAENMDKYKVLSEKCEHLNKELNKERLLNNNLRTDLNLLINDCHCSETVAARIRREYQL